MSCLLIPQLEDALQASAQDLKYSSSTIQADLDRFQRQKVADMREMCISMARIHKDWARKVRVYHSDTWRHICSNGVCRTLTHGKKQRKKY
jgi:hypothetical protein